MRRDPTVFTHAAQLGGRLLLCAPTVLYALDRTDRLPAGLDPLSAGLVVAGVGLAVATGASRRRLSTLLLGVVIIVAQLMIVMRIAW